MGINHIAIAINIKVFQRNFERYFPLSHKRPKPI
jgi:hypothetical protein